MRERKWIRERMGAGCDSSDTLSSMTDRRSSSKKLVADAMAVSAATAKSRCNKTLRIGMRDRRALDLIKTQSHRHAKIGHFSPHFSVTETPIRAFRV